MKLHSIDIKDKKPQRIARGGRRGTTSGRGQKGQKSRSGHRIRPALRDTLLRIPKKRGFRNKPTSDKPMIIPADKLAMFLAPLGKKEIVISITLLKQLGLVPAGFRGRAKVLAPKKKKDLGVSAKFGSDVLSSESVKKMFSA